MRRISENTLERTAKLLAAHHDIKVSFKPGVAETRKGQIILPSLPDNANQELVDAMQGYLDQQAGYVLFSEPNKIDNFRGQGRHNVQSSQLYDVLRAIEDARVEERMEDIYPGCELNFRNSHSWLYERLEKNWDKLSKFNKILAGSFLERRHPGSELYNTLVEEDLREKVSKVNDIIDRNHPNSCDDSLSLAREVMQLLEVEREEDAPQRQKQLDDQNKGNEGEGTNQSPMSAGNQPKAGEEQGQKQAQGQSSMGQALAQAAQQEIKAICDDRNQPMSPSGNNNGYQHNLGDGVGYTIYSTQGDSFVDVQEGNLVTNGKYLMQIRDESRRFTSIMRKRLVNSLRAMQQRRWVGGRPEGRLDTRKAYKAVHGISDNVYKVRTEKSHLDTAVALAIDHSGSMSGRPLELAAEAALVLGDVFDPLNIPFMVYGFSTDWNNQTYPQGADQHLFARWSSLWIGHYKHFTESWKKGSLKLAQARNNVKNNTLDGESILYGIRALMARPEKRKILFVFNDGGPYPGGGHVGRCQDYLKQIVKAGQAAGVEIICFGIQTDEVKHYYDNWVLINNLEDLVKEPLKLIDNMLRKGMLMTRK